MNGYSYFKNLLYLQLEVKIKLAETITNSFSWSQWDVHHQCLFYIHYKQAALKDDDEKPTESTLPTPILSALQFHDDLPHETVVSIFSIFYFCNL